MESHVEEVLNKPITCYYEECKNLARYTCQVPVMGQVCLCTFHCVKVESSFNNFGFNLFTKEIKHNGTESRQS